MSFSLSRSRRMLKISPIYFCGSSISGDMISYNRENLEIFLLFIRQMAIRETPVPTPSACWFIDKCILVILEVKLKAKFSQLSINLVTYH